ncbi:MAG: Asp-tRNA(Asn)/Glu-tRNA(Gln) amidotransferase GatCAB subunit C [Planctomycetia bacterium]|jgi:aspartyl-tRNA(Asn)/glutamyl-tRNA(Gln) amidotransferase subunit C|nr:Asp-tRNA(Asn)/Glu-tRNA(Gln) amidotransferase GatCAB subunit C [Planctomycetia bacterium]NCF99100.1 Asp-tRNA(Asn)/Glu-tRNA(Gln) amidotransferase GatCAB subunit C [Planctomycetia bacterium]NCG55770.1 Asp-tRNA(Asn)/Glu-tRNA(Gln) amidotransferase GatCAB subunit C [Pseudomonadota bacterium]
MAAESGMTEMGDRPVIDAELVRRTARLARLEVTEDEIPGLVDHLEKMLDLVEQLELTESKTSHEQLASARMDGEKLSLSKWREDVVAGESDPGGPRRPEKLGKNAPDWRDGSFVTPRVVGGD